MDELVVLDLASNAIRTAFLVSAPALLLGLVVGVAISLFQAVTSIQDPTLSFIPKILAVMLVILLAFPWMISVMKDFTLELFTNLNNFIR
ncbi:flagellar biosynthesis protein FliQ [Sulfidibacter corallicola]|uniref:Flagellar biosynthetic protein FliQ n=1 Tax=Sulfidibacter corallicola TaxID=2818388 RepID=A0A8A4TTM8_SULCO|nr:flagellar biosynthesis protein FliQ [Sulfidibacter corallicola]QTD52431.1 flagellar biosynthesis protein FliQ [Sulfidibacter corallicola]